MTELPYPESMRLPIIIRHPGGNGWDAIQRRIEIRRWLEDSENGCSGEFGIINTNEGFEYRFSNEASALLFKLKYDIT